jgi:membrane-bound serine protease (ClpP class)
MTGTQQRFRACGRTQRCLWGAGLLTVVLACASWASPAAPGPPAAKARTALVLTIDGVIGPAMADYVVRGLAQASQQDAALVVLRIDTPGGLDTSMREIIRAILASAVPVMGYVSPAGARAASAGTYILYASHVAAMAPGTNVGAATPVALGGGGPAGAEPAGAEPGDRRPGGAREPGTEGRDGGKPPATAMERKVVNDAVAYLRALAELRGRDADWADEAVRQGASLSADAAMTRGVIDFTAATLDAALGQADGRTVRIGQRDVGLRTAGLAMQALEPGWRTRLLGAITHPNVALILLTVGVYGLLFEFLSPGAVLPGTLGAISVLVGLYGLAALPLNFAGLGLVVLGLCLMIAEAFTPSLGALGLGGAVAFVLGATLLVDTDLPEFSVSWPLLAGVAAGALAAAGAAVLGGAHPARVRTRVVFTLGRFTGVKGPGLILLVPCCSRWCASTSARWCSTCRART